MRSLFDIVIEHSIKHRNDAFYKYMAKRMWSAETMDEWRLGFFPESGILSLVAAVTDNKYSASDLEKKYICKKIDFNYRSFLFGRIIFPIYSPHGKAIAVSGRVLDDSKPKYWNTAFSKGSVLFGLNITKKHILEKRRAHVFEGYADVISAYQSGIKNVTCCMGTALTEEHSILLSRYAEEIVVFFDNDSAGFEALQRFNEKELDEKRTDTKILRCFLNECKDVDDFLKTNSADGFNKYVSLYVADDELQRRLKGVSAKMSAKEMEAFKVFMLAKNDFLKAKMKEVAEV